MLAVTLTSSGNKGYLLCTAQDVDQYQTSLNQADEDTLGRWAIRYGIKNTNHLIDIVRAKRKYGSSISHELENHDLSRLENMRKFIREGYFVLVNHSGGYCNVDRDVEYVLTDRTATHRSHINQNSRFINLENDPTLESYTKAELKSLDPNYSFILNCRDITSSELRSALLQFKQQGGTGLWQYTTGLNHKQLRMFLDVAIEVGLTEFIVNFNFHQSLEITEIIQHYSNIPNIQFKAEFVTQ